MMVNKYPVEQGMTNAETAAWLREWVTKPRGPWSWPTDACGYDQHIRFVKHRNENWAGGDGPAFNQFVLNYADMIEKEVD